MEFTKEVMQIIILSKQFTPILETLSYENFKGANDLSMLVKSEHKNNEHSGIFTTEDFTVKCEEDYVLPYQYMRNLGSVLMGYVDIPDDINGSSYGNEILNQELFKNLEFRHLVFLRLYLTSYIPAIGIEPTDGFDEENDSAE